MTIYELPGERPELTLVGPDDANFWRMLGLPADGRHALVIGRVDHPTAATVLTGTRPDIHRYLDTLGQGPDSAGLFRDMVDINQAIRNALTEDERADLWPPREPAAGASFVPFDPEPDPVPGLTVLPHSMLKVPHTRLTVTSYKGHMASDGEAYVATLRLDRTIVGTIEDSGTGGEPMFHPVLDAGFGLRDLDAFANGCRDYRDKPVLPAIVLGELVAEFQGVKTVRRHARKNMMSVRKVMDYEDYGFESVTEYVGVPAGQGGPDPLQIAVTEAGQRHVARMLARDLEPLARGERWELWTGAEWKTIAAAEATAA